MKLVTHNNTNRPIGVRFQLEADGLLHLYLYQHGQEAELKTNQNHLLLGGCQGVLEVKT